MVQIMYQDSVEDGVSDKILTLPNAITFIRLCMVPLFFMILVSGRDALAATIYAIAAATDCLDGQIARRTGSVTKLGQLLDPAVDRLLMIFGVFGLLIVGRLPLWIILFVLCRDLYLLWGGWRLLNKYHSRIPVVFAGKVATTLLFVGFTGLLLSAPLVPGLGVAPFSWLPGFNAEPCSWGIWFVYFGLAFSVYTLIYYIREGNRAKRLYLASSCEGQRC